MSWSDPCPCIANSPPTGPALFDDVPDAPAVPEAPYVPDVPAAPDAPTEPDAPLVPDPLAEPVESAVPCFAAPVCPVCDMPLRLLPAVAPVRLVSSAARETPLNVLRPNAAAAANAMIRLVI